MSGLDVTRDTLMAMPERDLAALLWRATWERKAHKHQLEPEGDWSIWLLLAGRGSGKTRGAAEYIGWQAYKNPGTRWLVAAPTSEDVLTVCFEGESGLLACIPRELIKSFTMKPPEIILHNDSMIHGIPASEPDRYRGPQWHGIWWDEAAACPYAAEAFDMMDFSLRLGQRPRMLITTTPRPTAFIRDLVKRDGKDVKMVRTSSYANLANVAPTYRDKLLRHAGTQIGRQEIEAELLDPEEQGIIKRSQIRLWPADKQLPWFDYIVMSLDTAMTEETRDKETGDPDYTACGVWALFEYERRTNVMLIDAWQQRLGFPDLIKRVKSEMQAEYGQMEEPVLKPFIGPARVNMLTKKIDLLLVEGINSGKGLLQVLAQQGINGYSYNPKRDSKLARLHGVSHLFAGGVVWMVESKFNEGKPRTWAEPVLEQLCTFSGDGTIPHDDHVDQSTQALWLLSNKHMLDTIRAPSESQHSADNVVQMRREINNPYAV